MKLLRELNTKKSDSSLLQQRALIERIERYRIHDGPGIRTAVFFMGCPLRCMWCSNPETRELKQRIMYREEDCVQCGACVEICPEEAIHFSSEKIRIDRAICTCCGECVKVCPNDAVSIIGQWYSVDELVEELMKDEPFYDSSGGGVTITGGEPTVQMDFLEQLCRRLRKEYISIALDTCGLFDFERFLPISRLIDYVLFDLKIIDPALHHIYTGSDNVRILQNLQAMDELGMKLIIRMIVVPGINDSKEEIDKKCMILKNLNYVKSVDILQYHILGSGKYKTLGLEYKMPDHGFNINNSYIDNMKQEIENLGIPCTVGGI